MWTILNKADSLLDFFLAPFNEFHPIVGLTVISILTGIVMVLIYRFTSNQEAIRKVKNQIKIHFMEIRVYKEDMTQTLIAQKKILTNNFKYMALSLKPGLLLIFLIIFILAPLNVRYGYLPLKLGDSFIVTVKTIPGKSPVDLNITLDAPDAVEVETPPLRLVEEREINWRLKAKKAGEHVLQFLLPTDARIGKEIVIDQNGLAKIAPEMRQEGILAALYNPIEVPLPKNGLLEEVKINYPPRYFDMLGGWTTDWLVIFILISLGSGFLVKNLLKIE